MSDELVTLTIDDKEVQVAPGTLIVDAAAAVNVEIPIFCSHPKLDPVACCRMCLVEVEGPRGPMLQTACSVPVREGMVVHTDTEQVQATQEANLAFILLNHPLDCPICDKGGECPLQDQTMRFGPGISQLVEPKRHKQKDYHISDTIVLDQERCIICWRCIRYLEEWEDKPQLALFKRGGATLIDIQPGQPVDAKTGGNIIDICPVGALTSKVARFGFRPWQVERTPSIDPHFSTGDNIRIDTRTYAIRRIVGRENMGVNDQWIADKTRFAWAWVNSDERLTTPLVRKDGELQPATWSEALQAVTDGLKRVKERQGADAVGGIGSAKLSNEANYLLQRFMRQIVGTNNVDHRDGGDVAALSTGIPSLAAVMQPQYGPPPQYDVIMLVGVDPSEEAPILDLHIKRAVRRSGTTLVIAHPRHIELTRYPGSYLGYRPGSEATLLNGLARMALAVKGEENQTVSQLTDDATDERLLNLCGVDPEAVEGAARLLVEAKNPLILYGPMAAQGATGEQVRNGLTNLAMVLDCYENLGYLGLNANSQGCRDVGVLPDALPGHAPLDDEAARTLLAELWGGELPTAPGKTYRQMLDAAGDDIGALLVMGADPAGERPEWAANLAQLDFLAVQELFLTDTARLADVVLPAVSWAEGDGTFTNCERRIQRAPKAVSNPASKAAQDWMILDHIAAHMGMQWPYASAQGVLEEITTAIPAYAGLDWTALGDQGVQWNAETVRPRPAYRRCRQDDLPAAGEGELALVTGTVAYDGGTLFRLTQAMRDMIHAAAVTLNPDDAAQAGVKDNDAVLVRSAHGELRLRAAVSEEIEPGTAWIPESLPGAPVGALLNGREQEFVTITPQ
ncbi:MAG: NADH-quinone oxidoreductase subunit NuoG [Caldilineaceae bacterium]|nr:NADH-quinone oxidoreductase subunit NuoG [Caldilineaceae bacterium]